MAILTQYMILLILTAVEAGQFGTAESRYGLVRGSELPAIRFHDLRHSAATLLILQGVHPRTVMEILGHKDLRTTMQIYGHVVDEMKQAAASKMDELFGSVATSVATKRKTEGLLN